MFEAPVISCSEKKFKGDDGKSRIYYRVYIMDANGDVGFVYSQNAYKQGQPIKLTIKVDGKTQKFTVGVVE